MKERVVLVSACVLLVCLWGISMVYMDRKIKAASSSAIGEILEKRLVVLTNQIEILKVIEVTNENRIKNASRIRDAIDLGDSIREFYANATNQ